MIEKVREFQEIIYFCFIDYDKAFDCVDHNKLWKIPQEMGIPDHLTCLLRNLYAGQEATVRIRHGTIDRFQIGKGVRQDCVLSPSLLNFYAEYKYIKQNAGLDESQAAIKIAGKNINNLRYAHDTTLMAERCLLLGRKATANLDNMLESRDITLLTKVHIIKMIIFPVVMYRQV